MRYALLPSSPRGGYTMVMPAGASHRWTGREVRQLMAAAPLATPRYEVVDGELLVTPSPSAAHQRAITQLFALLLPYLERERVGVLITSPCDVELEPDVVTQPDMCVVPSPEWQRVMREGFPVRELMLAIEILSPSSSRHDRIRKRPVYQRRVPDYWIVDLDARLFEHWKPGSERPGILTDSMTWHPAGATTPFVLDIPTFFAAIFDA